MAIAAVSNARPEARSMHPILVQALSETIVETTKAQTYHWNVTGMAFGPLHALFQEIYEDHFAAQDLLAERIRALGEPVDGRPSAALAASTITECDGMLSGETMLKRLVEDQRRLSETLGDLAQRASDTGDVVTEDMAIERMRVHDKFAWMLSAHVAE